MILTLVKKITDNHGRISGCIAIDENNQRYYIPKQDFLKHKFTNVSITKDLKIKQLNSQARQNEITLYHGSHNGIIGEIRADLSRELCDFGRGFYTGDKPEQAKTLIVDDKSGVFYTLKANLRSLRVYNFDDNIKWAIYIGINRGHIDKNKYSKLLNFVRYVDSHDLVISPIADDRMMFIYSEFIEGNITDIALINCLQYVKLGKQYVFKNNKACKNIRVISEGKLDESEARRLKHTKNVTIGNISKYVDEVKLKFRRQGKYIDEILENWG